MDARSTDLALEARELVKTYPGGRGKPAITALQGLSFTAAAGTIFGVLGPNGAGKSTMVKILATLSRADSGSAFVVGVDVRREPDRVRHLIGFVAQKQVSDPMDTGLENLVLAGRLQGLRARAARARADELLGRFSLEEAAHRQVKTYSGGMARKLDVAIGLMHRPQVLFLDEPTTGLDPQARAELWAEIQRMARAERLTVLLTTHYLEEADHLADRLVIVDRGRVVAEGAPAELKSQLHGDAVVVELRDGAQVPLALAALGGIGGLREITSEPTPEGAAVRARADDGARSLPDALAVLDSAGVRIASATVARPSLDDVYLRHTGHSFAHGDRSGASAESPDLAIEAVR